MIAEIQIRTLLLLSAGGMLALSSCSSEERSNHVDVPEQKDRAFPPIKPPVDFETPGETLDQDEEKTFSVADYSEKSVRQKQRMDLDMKTRSEQELPEAEPPKPQSLSFEDRVRLKEDPVAAATKVAEMIESLANEMREHHRHIGNREMALKAKLELQGLTGNRDTIRLFLRDLDGKDEEISKIVSEAQATMDEVVGEILDDFEYGTTLGPVAEKLSDYFPE